MVPFTGSGAVLVKVLITKYLFGAGEAAIKFPLKPLLVILVKKRPVGWAVGVLHGVGKFHVKVKSWLGNTVLFTAKLELLAPPAVVADQLAVVTLLLKSVLVFPLKPTWTVLGMVGPVQEP